MAASLFLRRSSALAPRLGSSNPHRRSTCRWFASGKDRVAVIGSGNWGSVAARIVAQNALKQSDVDDTVNMWVFEEQLPVGNAEFEQAFRHRAGQKGALDAQQLHELIAEDLALGEASFGKQIAETVVGQFAGDGNALSLPELQRWWTGNPLAEQPRKLTELINRRGENVKYLQGINLGPNVRAVADLRAAVQDASLLVFVTPHQFVKGVCEQLKGHVDPSRTRAISLIKGMDVRPDGFDMISGLIERELGLDCSVLMGANIAREIGLEQFSEATVGYRKQESGIKWQRLFNTPYFHVNAVEDVAGAEVCGTLKNIVALASGFVDGMGLGNNTKAAIIRVGLLEMLKLAQTLDPSVKAATMFESCGVADLITTCYGGRNRKVAEAFVKRGGKQSWESLEAELLNGQKLQGVLTSNELQELLHRKGLVEEFPLFVTINRIVNGHIPPEDLVRFQERP